MSCYDKLSINVCILILYSNTIDNNDTHYNTISQQNKYSKQRLVITVYVSILYNIFFYRLLLLHIIVYYNRLCSVRHYMHLEYDSCSC